MIKQSLFVKQQDLVRLSTAACWVVTVGDVVISPSIADGTSVLHVSVGTTSGAEDATVELSTHDPGAEACPKSGHIAVEGVQVPLRCK